MDISQASSLSSIVSSVSSNSDNAGIAVLNKALVNEVQTAKQLVNSLPEPTKPTPSGSLGHNIDVKA